MFSWLKYYQEDENKKEVLDEMCREISVLNQFAKKDIQAYCLRRLGEWKEQEMLEQRLKNRKIEKQPEEMSMEEFMEHWGAL